MDDTERSENLIKLTTEKFLPWLELQFSKKYEVNLEGLRERFLGIYTFLKMILEQVMEIDQILMRESQSTSSSQSRISNYSSHKPLFDNIILLLTMMIKEFTGFIDLEFVENFLCSVEERLTILLAHFHQILHISHSDPNISYKVSQHTKTIDNAITQIPNCVINIQKRAELSVTLLKYIRDSKNMFRTPLKKLREEIQKLAENKSHEEFEKVMEDVKNRSKTTMKFRIDFINKMIDLGKENSLYQFELNKMLKPYISMSSIIKTKGKKFLNENIKSTDQAKITKYVDLLVKPNFCNTILPSTDMNELLYVFKLFETQTKLVNEYKKTLLKGIEEYQTMNPVEFEITVDKFKQVIADVNNFQDFTKKNSENIKMSKENINQVLKDIKKVVDKYQEFQNGIYHYQAILDLFQKIRDLVTKFCYSEFGVKVELICEYNL